MRNILSRLLMALLPLATSAAWAQAANGNAKLLDDIAYCYALSSMANMTALQRNAGQTHDDQMARRGASLGADSNEYKLVEQISQQIYAKDIKNPLAAAVETHRACLDGKGLLTQFNGSAVQQCPVVGVLVAEVSAARRSGATIEQVVALLGERYGSLAKTYGGGAQKLAARYAEGGKGDNGASDYSLCMALGIN